MFHKLSKTIPEEFVIIENKYLELSDYINKNLKFHNKNSKSTMINIKVQKYNSFSLGYINFTIDSSIVTLNQLETLIKEKLKLVSTANIKLFKNDILLSYNDRSIKDNNIEDNDTIYYSISNNLLASTNQDNNINIKDNNIPKSNPFLFDNTNPFSSSNNNNKIKNTNEFSSNYTQSNNTTLQSFFNFNSKITNNGENNSNFNLLNINNQFYTQNDNKNIKNNNNFASVINTPNPFSESAINKTKLQIEILIKTLTGKKFSLKIFDNITVLQLKSKLKELEGIPEDQQILMFNGNQLEDNQYLKDYSICDKDTIHFILRLKGC